MILPDNDIEAYCAYANNQDDIQKDEETRVCDIFTTKQLLSFLSKSDTIHVDATYRLNWQRYPVMIVEVSNSVGKFLMDPLQYYHHRKIVRLGLKYLILFIH